MKPLIAVYPGTFDPVTLGHIDVIKRATNLCDSLIIGVAAHTNKNHLFNLEMRQKMLQSVIDAENLSTVKILPIKHLTVNFVKENNATLIIRALRTLSDFDHEFQMVSANKILDPNIETIFLPAALQNHCISSSVVRQIHAAGGDLTNFIHNSIINYF